MGCGGLGLIGGASGTPRERPHRQSGGTEQSLTVCVCGSVCKRNREGESVTVCAEVESVCECVLEFEHTRS